MNSPLPLDAKVSLYSDTASHITGQFFCNSKPFALPRPGNKVSILSSGQDALQQIHDAMMKAESFIWIADWQMACDVELTSRGVKDSPGRLHNVIAYIISKKKVHIRIILYRSVKDELPGTFDGLVADRLNSLNKPEYPGSVAVMLQGPTTNQLDAHDYSHHQKFVVVDGNVGFIGGIDISYGRWETPRFDVVVDPERFILNEMYNPCQTKIRKATTAELEKIEKYKFVGPYGDKLIDEGCQPRMPFQDVHVKIEGPSVVDIHRNFVRRWNIRTRNAPGTQDYGIASTVIRSLANKLLTKKPITQAWLESIGAWERLAVAQQSNKGGAHVQIVRSVSSSHLQGEGTTPADLLLHRNVRERAMWSECLTAWQTHHQPNILNAMVNCIRGAQNYIYIETQFFISTFGTAGAYSSERMGNRDEGIKNTIVDELAKCIDKHIRAKNPHPFHVYLVIPTYPEGLLTDEATWKQHWLAQSTIKHGTHSLVNKIKQSLMFAGRDGKCWPEYLTVLNMRNYGATVMYARQPGTFDEDYSREIGRYVVTEQIYIHSKLLIIDDAVAIVGSANINDRSLSGDGDTEIAAVVVDIEGVELSDLGAPAFKVQTRKFARELRRSLWKKHFGFFDKVSNEDADYFRSTNRASRKKIPVPEQIPYPPREAMNEAVFDKIARGSSWQKILDQPCAPSSVQAIQNIAKTNSDIYESVFSHTARNSIATLEEIASMKYYSVPYAATYNGRGSLLYRLAEDDLKILKHKHGTKSPATYHLSTNIEQDGRSDGVIVAVGGLERLGAETFGGVIPPALKSQYMTASLHPHQQLALREPNYWRRQQLYPGNVIHNVEAAILALQKITGFFTLAPLDWGRGQPVKSNPSKATGVGVDIALAPTGGMTA